MVGSGEILVILVIALILFGGKKLPEFAKNLGHGIREFKKACYESQDTSSHPISKSDDDSSPPTALPPS